MIWQQSAARAYEDEVKARFRAELKRRERQEERDKALLRLIETKEWEETSKKNQPPRHDQ